MQDIGCSLMPPLLAYIHDNSESWQYGYGAVNLAILGFLAASMVIKVALKRHDDTVRGGVLDSK